jgi:ornithine cyclodeaminase/alanine dehydrogenase-like protein (mu-crystallin family)
VVCDIVQAVLDADRVAGLGFPRAVAALREALAAGLDPESEPPRASVRLGGGEVLIMPSSAGPVAGIKLVSVVPGNPARGLPRIHGVYVLFDGQTLVPRALVDGAALTSLRTPAVSALGIDLVAPPEARRLVIFGTGPQAFGHVRALRAIRPIDSVRVVGRAPSTRGCSSAGRARATGTSAGRDPSPDPLSPLGRFIGHFAAEGLDVAAAGPEAVAEADIVACCTTARTPLFPGELLPPHAVVVAVGSHEPDAREVDTETVRRCGALVESRAAATREAGDIMHAIADGAIGEDELVTFADLVRGTTPARPRLIKTVGMGWEDLVIAAAVVDAA